MKPLNESLHFSQQSWLYTARQLQRLHTNWQQVCLAAGIVQAAQCHLNWQAPVLTVKCSAALAVRLRQATPDLVINLNQYGWACSEIICNVERSAQALQHAWNSQQAPWVNKNELNYGKRTQPNTEQSEALHAFKQTFEKIKKQQRKGVQRAISKTKV